jgi:hypothetical protein
MTTVRLFALPAAISFVAASHATAQSARDGPVLAARHVVGSATFKIFNSRGAVRLIAWDRDSLLVRGRLATPGSFTASGDTLGLKISVDDPPSGAPRPTSLVIYVPRRSRATIKAVNADVDDSGVGGWIYTITGSVRVRGSVGALEIESMRGPVDIDARVPWLRVRGGDGAVVVRGSPEDADISTITGTLDVATTGVVRGQFGSVSGAVQFRGSPVSGGIYEFSNHSGETVLSLPANVSAVVSMSNIAGRIENEFPGVRPVSAAPHSLRLTLGHGDAEIIVRSFKGPIRIGPQ